MDELVDRCSARLDPSRTRSQRCAPEDVNVCLNSDGTTGGRRCSRSTSAPASCPPGVSIEYNHIFRVVTAAGELQAQHSGRVLHRAEGRHELAAVGDWVAVRPSEGEQTGTIEEILPRRSRFSRKVAGELTEEQVVAANIDTVFLVMGLDRDYNPRRLERYLLMAYESGASPVVLLSKADLATDLPARVAEITGLAPGTPVHAISASPARGRRHRRAARHVRRRRSISGRAAPARCSGRPAWGSRRSSTRSRARIAEDSRGPSKRFAWPAHHAPSSADRSCPVRACSSTRPACASCSCGTSTEARARRVRRHRGSWRPSVTSPIAAIATSRAAPSRRRSLRGVSTADRLASYLKLQDEMRALDARKDARAQIDDKRRAKVMGRAQKQLYKDRGRE